MAIRRFCPPESSRGERAAGELQRGEGEQTLVHTGKAGAKAHMLIDLSVGQAHVLRPEGDVPVNRFLKQLVLRILEHQTHTEADITQRLLGAVYVLPVKQNAAGRGREQSVQMLDQSAFPASGVAEDRHVLTGRYIQRYIVQRGFFKGSAAAVHVPKRLKTDICHNDFPLIGV